MIGQTVSHYRILSKLGTGGMGAVYLAEDEKLHRKVAIKFLPEADAANADVRKRFLHEAGAHAKLSHPSIATFHDVEDSDDRPFIVMEYVDGKTLSEWAESESPSLSESLDIVIQIGEGLQAAHAEGVVHRDIKPGNLMVARDGKVRILDFGLARWRGASKITKTGTQLGTAAYMSPEQAVGKKVDHRSDIFSLGVVLYELACNRRPFEGDSEQATMYELLNEEPQPLARYCRDAPPALQQLVSKCLAKRTDERYQSVSDLLADLRRVKREMDSGTASGVSLSTRKKKLPYVLTALAVILAVVAVYYSDRIGIFIKPDQGAVAAENTLAVMYFDNMVDPEDTDRTAGILTSLLITDLTESSFLRVTSRQRLLDIMNQLGHGDARSIGPGIAAEVAKTARVRYIVTGDIVQTEPTLLITSTISEAHSGINISAYRIAGQSGESVFDVVDSLSVAIKADLNLPAGARSEPERAVADVTTRSPEAYRHYLDGLDYESQYLPIQAVKSYKKAVEYDSTFAMAHYRLADKGAEAIPIEQRIYHVERAKEYAHTTTWKEQKLIAALAAEHEEDYASLIRELEEIIERDPEEKEAYYWLGITLASGLNPDTNAMRAREALETAIRLDPGYKRVFNVLAWLYQERFDDLEKGLWALNEYIALAPDEPNPLDSRGDLYFRQHKYPEAMASWQDALEVDPSFADPRRKLADEFLFRLHDFPEAERHYKILASSPEQGIRSEGRLQLAMIPLFRGQFTRGLEILDQGLAADELDGAGAFFPFFKHFYKARALADVGEWTEAMTELQLSSDVIRDIQEVKWEEMWAEYHAVQGRHAQADSVLDAVLAGISEDAAAYEKAAYECALGRVMYIRGDYEAAVGHCEKCVADMFGGWLFYSQYLLGRALLKNGQLGEAAEIFEKAEKRLDNSKRRHAFWASKVYYYLGVVYHESGWDNRAIEELETFLDIWSEADPGQEIVDDAKQRLADLKS